MAFTPEDVQRLAKLARIELGSAQVNATLGHLDNIFGMIAEMRQVDTSGIAYVTTRSPTVASSSGTAASSLPPNRKRASTLCRR